jgi:hypothetical protein
MNSGTAVREGPSIRQDFDFLSGHGQRGEFSWEEPARRAGNGGCGAKVPRKLRDATSAAFNTSLPFLTGAGVIRGDNGIA